MTGSHPVNNDPEMKLIKRRNAKLIARSAVALTLSAAMGTAMIPVPALAEAADQAAAATEQQAEATNEAVTTTGQASAASAATAAENGAEEDAAAETATAAPAAADAPVAETAQEPSIADKLANTQASTAENAAAPAFTALEAVQTSTAEEAPSFDPKDVAYNAGDMSMTVVGESQGSFSVSQVAQSWTATNPKQDADGNWTVDLTFVPKAENKIAGRFGDNGYELDEESSKLTVTCKYNENSGWHAFEKEERGILAFKTASDAPDNPDQSNVPDKPDQPATPDEPTTPTGPSANTDKNAAASDNGAKQASDKTENKSGTASKQADAKQVVPDTGDTTGIAAMLAAALGAASIALAGVCKAFGLRRKDR